MYTSCIRIHHMVSSKCKIIAANHINTVNPEKLLLIVMTDCKEYIHHTTHLTNTSLPYKTIIKTTDKNGLGLIKPRQRPNRWPNIKQPMHTSSQPYIHSSKFPPVMHLTTTSIIPSISAIHPYPTKQ